MLCSNCHIFQTLIYKLLKNKSTKAKDNINRLGYVWVSTVIDNLFLYEACHVVVDEIEYEVSKIDPKKVLEVWYVFFIILLMDLKKEI